MSVPFWNCRKLFSFAFKPLLINPAHNVSCRFGCFSAVAKMALLEVTPHNPNSPTYLQNISATALTQQR
jgi:hypothetical protein